MVMFEKINYWSKPAESVLTHFETSLEGLSANDAALRLREYGENMISAKKKTSQWMLFLNQFKNPIVIILLIATIISAATSEWSDAIIILLIVLSSSVLSFF